MVWWHEASASPGHVPKVRRSLLGLNPNDLWCTDYKGEFKLGNQRYCYPLTVTDHASRYLLLCEAMESNREQPAFTGL